MTTPENPASPSAPLTGSATLVLQLIEMRRKSAAKELATAIANKQWSQVAGYDGIEIGLIMAAKIVREEMPPNDRTERPEAI